MATPQPSASRTWDRTIAISVRVVAGLIVGMIAVLALTVYFDRQRDLQTTPAARIEQAAIDAVKKNPSDPAPRISLAQSYLELGRFDDAIRASNDALKLSHNSAGAYLVQGLAWLNKRDYANAERNFRQVIDLLKNSEMAKESNNLEQAYYYMGVLYYQQKQWDKAMEGFKAASSINRASSDTLTFMGQIYLKKNAPDLAAEVLEDAVAYDPNYAPAQYSLGQAYERLHQRTLAAQHYRLAWEASGQQMPTAKKAMDRFGDPADLLQAGKRDIASGKLDSGVRRLELALALDPLFLNANVALAHAYERQADQAKSAKERRTKLGLAYGMYKRVKQLSPKYPGVGAAMKRIDARLGLGGGR